MADPMQTGNGGSAVNAMIDQEPVESAAPATPEQTQPASPVSATPQETAPATAAPDLPPKTADGGPADTTGESAAEDAGASVGAALLDAARIQSIKVKVQAMLGGAALTVSQLSELKQGDTISLNSKIGDPVQILANGQLIGHGQLVIVESDPPSFGIRLDSIVDNI